jgi:rod shape-determining protein MreD
MERAGFMFSSRIFANTIPVLLGILGAVVANLPVSILGGAVPAPLLALMPIYFWCLVRPDLMSPAWAFGIGVLEDILSGGPPGIWGAAFVMTYAVIERQRDVFAGLSGFGAMLGFATAASVACGSAYVIVSIYHWHVLPLAPIVSELAVTVLFYLPIAALLGLVHRQLVGPLRSDF